MPKAETYYQCQGCGHRSSKWLGRCPGCGEWETFVEERREAASPRHKPLRDAIVTEAVPLPFDGIDGADTLRVPTGNREFDRVLGGGLVPGSLVLLGGEPGVGKSTLLLQVAGHLAATLPVLYVSGEESARQVKMRGERMGLNAPNLYVFAENRMDAVTRQAVALGPGLLVIDSIQTLFAPELESAAGSIGQVRECASRLLMLGKSSGTAVCIVGHITKDGAIAGPKALEHIVDTVLYFEGERHHHHRIVRAVKNRFGASGEVALFEMTSSGLLAVGDPSSLLLAERPEGACGVAVICSIEGSRPLMVEIQALVSLSQFTAGRRMTQGFDRNRLSLLLAMLERSAGLNLLGADVYLNMVGGIEVEEPAADLGTVAAVVSSFRGRPIPGDTAFIGEVGLAGEVRSVPQASLRIKETVAMGFRRLVAPAGNIPPGGDAAGLEIVPVTRVREMLDIVF